MLFHLVFLSFLLVAFCAPVEYQHEKRRLNGILGSYTGILGVSATYDYVIVGGGTAGLTLAERLSENSAFSVAVIEAGTFYQGTKPLISRTPAGAFLGAGSDPADTNLADWDFITVPQSGANGRSIHYAQGKTLGGSSARNVMIYQRGTRQSYQMWADAVGDQTYTFDDLLPLFKKSISFTPPKVTRALNATAGYNTAAFDGKGPLQVSYANYAAPFSSYVESSLIEIGVPQTRDFNSGSLLGCQYCSSTIRPRDETRDSSQTSFLHMAAVRSNLKIYDLTFATKVLFNAANEAIGVSVTSNTGLTTYKINARKEVILSAGAFRSPQLLMVSGVGPKATLQQFDVPIVADRPGVGQGMQDHVFFGPTWRVKVQTFTRLANDLLHTSVEFLDEYQRQLGPLTNPVCDFLGWEKLPRTLLSAEAQANLSQFPADWPEMEYLSIPGYVGDFANLFLTQPKKGYQYASILGGIVAPLSRGTVTISSTDTLVNPIINPNWLTDPTDITVAIGIYKRLRQAFASSAMKSVLADATEYFPGPSIQTDEQILDTIRNTFHTMWHASCTCRMGRMTDLDAVVDSNAKVIGVTKLRVVDASAFALLPPGHPQSTVYVLAEKVAAAILAGN